MLFKVRIIVCMVEAFRRSLFFSTNLHFLITDTHTILHISYGMNLYFMASNLSVNLQVTIEEGTQIRS